MFCVGDKIVHPMHGAGVIESIVDEKIGKVPEELYEELDALEMRLNRGYKRK